MPRNCFTYGSLMYEPIMFAVCGLGLHSVAATLPGFSRHPVRGEDYPGIIRHTGAQVAGRLYLDLPAEALARLDAFEGSEYQRIAVSVECDTEAPIEAHAYLFCAGPAHLELTRGWDYARFLDEGRERFERQYVGYKRL